MSYYLLPKKQQYINNIFVSFNTTIVPIISSSILHYINIAENFINCIKNKNKENEISNIHNFDLYYKIVNPYDFIYNKVPDSNFSVSKFNSLCCEFYIFLEISKIFKIFDQFNDRNIKTLHCSENNTAIIECINMFRENYNDINYSCEINRPIQNIDIMTIDFLYFELNSIDYSLNINNYIFNFIKIMNYIHTYQNINGICIIKIDVLVIKPILDIIYMLTGMYEKIIIIKPNTSNIFKNERFIVCKNFISDSKTTENGYLIKNIINKIDNKSIDINNDTYICSLLNFDLPYYFLSKIEESNVIIGQLQLEQYEQLINLIKNKNKIDKIETLKKNNIQKCIQWCEKFKIPYNKFVCKLNIFLPIICNDNTDIIDNVLIED